MCTKSPDLVTHLTSGVDMTNGAAPSEIIQDARAAFDGYLRVTKDWSAPPSADGESGAFMRDGVVRLHGTSGPSGPHATPYGASGPGPSPAAVSPYGPSGSSEPSPGRGSDQTRPRRCVHAPSPRDWDYPTA
jgi:hypothetical protein